VYRSTTGARGTGIGYTVDSRGRLTTYTGGKSGVKHDMRKDAPGACFNCGGPHWRAYCPRRNKDW